MKILRTTIDDPGTITGKNHPLTSFLAAEKALGRSGNQRHRIYDYIIDCGFRGATDDEISVALGISLNSVRPRRVEIYELGLISRSGQTRDNVNGNACDVWVAL